MSDSLPEYTPLEALRKFEREWGLQLGGVALVGELEVLRADAATILRALVRQQRRDPRLLQRYPACVAVSMSLCAQRVYRGGALWDGLFEVIGERRDPQLEARLGNAFLNALDSLGKARPEDSHFRFVAPMALHACIPDYCIKDLLSLLAWRQEVSPGLDGASLTSWLNGPGGLPYVDRLDRPVRDFFRDGDDYAIDLVDRLLDLLDLLRRGERDSERLLSGSGVPKRFVTSALSSLQHGELELHVVIGAGPTTNATVFPGVALDLARWSIVLRLPSVTPDGRAWWNVTLDSEARRVASLPSTGLGDAEAPTEMVVDKPTRSLGVGLGTSELRYDIDLVNSHAPVVAFDEDGTLIPLGAPLPAGPVWLLRPSADETQDLRFHGPGRTIADAIGPVGWVGWSLQQIDLRGTRSISINDVQFAVRRSARARLILDEPLTGIHTTDGEPVHASRPTIDIPMSTVEQDWAIEVRGVRDDPHGSIHTWTIPGIGDDDDSDVAVVDPFDGWSSPIVGSFEIRARGPLGTRSMWRVSICEGLRVLPSVECRSFVPGGLTRMTVRLDSTTGLVREPSTIEFGVSDRTSRAKISASHGALLAEIEPQHLEICHAHTGGSSEWSSQPLTLSSDTREPFGVLEVRMPTSRELPPLMLHTTDGLSQSLVSHRGGAFGLHRFELARLSDTISAHKVADLQWDFGSEKATLVHFRPEQLASSVSLESGMVVLNDFVGASNVAAGVYFMLAPWRDPVIVHFNEQGVANCPEDLLSAGPLRAVLRVEDPWVPAPWERWRGQGLPIDQQGSPVPVNPAEGQVISYLAGTSPVPYHSDCLPYLWELLDRRHELRAAGVKNPLKSDITLVFRGRWLEAVQALQHGQIDPATTLRLAIRLGLIEQVIPLSPDDARNLWPLYPAIASLAASAHDAPTDAVVARCGPSALQIMKGGPDPHASSGRFTDSLRLDALPREAVTSMLEISGIVPDGLLDEGTRVMNALELFLARNHWSLIDAGKHTDASVAAAVRVIADAGYGKLAKAIESRPESTIHRHWQRLPQMSLLMAGLARVGSRGVPSALRALEELRESWASMTKTAHRFVATDIVLAELLVISDEVSRHDSTTTGGVS